MTYDDIYDYMIEVMPQYTDFVTDEVNTTFLAEDACNHFKAYIGKAKDIPFLFYDVAFEVATNNGLNIYQPLVVFSCWFAIPCS